MGKRGVANHLKFPKKFSHNWTILLFCALGMVEFSYFSLRGKGYDFPVFYAASRLSLNFQSPWDAVFDPIYSAYLNGPLTALVISPLSLVPQNIALGITRALSIVLIPFLTYQISKYFSPYQDLRFLNKRIWLASSIIMFTFPIRANLEYGQFFIIFLAFAILALRLSSYETKGSLLLAGFLIGVCCDYKPQCFMVFALLICFKNRYIFLGGVFSIISGALLSVILTRKAPYLVWCEVILKKFKGGATGDQMHIYVLFPGLWSILVLIVISAFAVAYLLRYRNKVSVQQRSVLIIFITVLLSPWMHPTDLALFAVFVVGIAIRSNGLTLFSSLALGSLLVWSNNVTISIFVALLSFFILFLYLGRNQQTLFVYKFLIIMPSIFFAIFSKNNPEVEDLLRKLFGIVSLFCATFLATISVSEKSRKDLSTSS